MARLPLLAATLLLVAAAANAARPDVLDEATLRPAMAWEEWSGKRPSLADVDGDGDLELLAQNGNGRVYVIDVEEARILAEVSPRYPYGPDLGPFNGPQAADLDGDGLVELVNVNRAAVVSVWTLRPHEGSLSAELRWETHLDEHHGHPTADAGPALGDLDGDGPLEIVVQTEETGVYALRADGSTLWSLDRYGGNAEPVIADVDSDGDPDVVIFTDGGVVYAVEGATGEERWSFSAARHGVWPASITAPGVVVDLDGRAPPEVVFCTRNVEHATPAYAPGAPSYQEHHFVLFAVREGDLVWKAKPSWGNPLCAAYLFAFDDDGDGTPEVFGMDWNTIGHKPGGWERTGDPNVFSFTAQGKERWHRAVPAYNGKATIAAGDWSGDGRQDIVAYGTRSLEVLDAGTGGRLASVPLGGWSLKQGPLLADFAQDGRLDALVAVEGASHAFLLVESGASWREPAWAGWERHAQGRPPPPPAIPTQEVPPASPPDEPERATVPIDAAAVPLPPASAAPPEAAAQITDRSPIPAATVLGTVLALALAARRHRG